MKLQFNMESNIFGLFNVILIICLAIISLCPPKIYSESSGEDPVEQATPTPKASEQPRPQDQAIDIIKKFTNLPFLKYGQQCANPHCMYAQTKHMNL